MTIATYLLFALGCMGAADIVLFKTIAESIRRHWESRHELIAHSLRGPSYAALFVFVPNCVMQGAWFWVLVGLLVICLSISVWDFAIERRSRRWFGGPPKGEYRLHFAMGLVFWGLVTVIVFESAPWARLPTELAWEPAPVPSVLRWILMLMTIPLLLGGVMDLVAALRVSPAGRGAEARAAAQRGTAR
jgi:hypothetical protein